MKKALYLLPLLLILFSCSKEETEPENDDPIIGIWNYETVVYYSEEEGNKEYPASDCIKQSTLNFEADGTLKTQHYEMTGQGECILNEWATDDDLKWEWVADSQLKISGDAGSSIRDEVLFPDEKTMIFRYNRTYNRAGVEYEMKDEIYIRSN